MAATDKVLNGKADKVSPHQRFEHPRPDITQLAAERRGRRLRETTEKAAENARALIELLYALQLCSACDEVSDSERREWAFEARLIADEVQRDAQGLIDFFGLEYPPF